MDQYPGSDNQSRADDDCIPAGKPSPEDRREVPDDVNAGKSSSEATSDNTQPHTFLNDAKPHERWNLLCQVLLVAIGASYTFYAAKQWNTMQIAIQQTNDSLRLAKDALEQNKRQIQIAEGSLRESEKGNATASGALQVSRLALKSGEDSFKIDQWPYIEALVRRDPDHPIENGRHAVTLILINRGKSPAQKVVIKAFAKVLPWDFNKPLSTDFALAEEKQTATEVFRRAVVIPTASGQSLPPGQDSSLRIQAESSNEPKVFTNLPGGPLSISIMASGTITYNDVFGSSHETEFCAFTLFDYTSRGPGTVTRLCAIHNVMR
jgi:hypothetical protein